MKRSEDADIERRRFPKGSEHLLAVLRYDAAVVAPRFRLIIFLIIQFIGPDASLKRAKAAESIRAEEDLIFLIIGERHFRPVHHRRREEPERMPPEGDRCLFACHGVALFHGAVEKLFKQTERLRASRQLRLRVKTRQCQEGAAVIRLHVVDDDVIQRPPAEERLCLFQKFIGHMGIHRIDDRRFFIVDKIRIVRDPPYDGKDLFKTAR